LSQQARAHRCLRAVQHREQRALGTAAAQRLDELQVAPRHLVQRHGAAGALHLRTGEMRHAAGLQFLQVSEQRARRAYRGIVLRFQPEPIESLHAELTRQVVTTERLVELPALTFRDERAVERRSARQ